MNERGIRGSANVEELWCNEECLLWIQLCYLNEWLLKWKHNYCNNEKIIKMIDLANDRVQKE